MTAVFEPTGSKEARIASPKDALSPAPGGATGLANVSLTDKAVKTARPQQSLLGTNHAKAGHLIIGAATEEPQPFDVATEIERQQDPHPPTYHPTDIHL